MGFFSKLFGKGDDSGSETVPRDLEGGGPRRLRRARAQQGGSLEEILEDPYLKNRATDEQRLRLLERPEVIRAVGEDTAAMAAEHVRETS